MPNRITPLPPRRKDFQGGDLSFTIDMSGLNLEGTIDRIISIFIGKVASEMLLAMQSVMPYSGRVSRRGQPPYSKSGSLVMSLRAGQVNGRRVNIYGNSYGRSLDRNLGRTLVTSAWRKVRPKLQSLLNDAVREAQR